MKNYLLLFMFVYVTPAICFGQKPTVIKDEFYSCKRVETPAAFPGGRAGLMQFFERNFQYPDSVAQNEISGRIECRIIVSKEGCITEVTISKSPGLGLDEEAMRILKLSTQWIPATRNGRPVAERLEITFLFGTQQIEAENYTCNLWDGMIL